MVGISKIEVCPGIVWVEVSGADLRLLCGCPADSVKHLMRRGLIRPAEVKGVRCESGPNAILLSDVALQNGAFCNLAEFPVLQMLYRQGMLLPNHPNNTGRRPLLIGRRDLVESQMRYIYRGNYGLVSEAEMVAAGASPELAREMMRLKLRFAFGKIQDSRSLLDGLVLPEDQSAVEIVAGVTIRRTALNKFTISHGDDSVEVDLNLPPYESHECPYPLGAFQFRREYFAVVHSGEGDGWDIHRPSMGAIIVFQGRIYLVDAGPNLLHALTALGIGVNEIEGIFHTHCHDDHFAGLTTLIQGDHRVKYYAAPLVRASVTKKLSALLGIEEDDFEKYFEIHDLEPERWNDIDGLDVRPVYSPHPVETTVMVFRAMAAGGWRSYAHLADVVAMRTLEAMVTEDASKPGISRAWADRVRAEYLVPVDVKKVDIGGGLIHGDSEDFRDDPSGKIILAHTAFKLNSEQKRIGSGASFGTVDVLVPSHRDFVWRSAADFLAAYFPSISGDHLNILLNGPVRTFNPETILLKEGQPHQSIFLLLTGQVEMLDGESDFRSSLSAGALLGEMTGLHGLPPTETYRAVSFVQALEIPCDLYLSFVERHHLFAEISMLMESREFLRKTWLFGGIMATRTLNAIAKAMTHRPFAAGESIDGCADLVGIVSSGRFARLLGATELESLEAGDFFGEEMAVFGVPAFTSIVATTPAEVYFIPAALLREIPNVRLKLFETFELRTRLLAAAASGERARLRWHDDYSVGIEAIDKQHRRLFDLANQLAVEIGSEAVAEAVESLVAYTMYHFAEEEGLLRRHGYSEVEGHQQRHRTLLDQVREFGDRLSGTGLSADELTDFLHKWIVNHILIEDRKFGPFLNSKGVW